MARKFQFGIIATLCVAVAGTSMVPITPAQAQGIFEFLRSPRERELRRQRAYQKRLYKQEQQRKRQQVRAPRISVKATRYYKYKAEKPRLISFKSLSTIATASADDLTAPTIGNSPFDEARPFLAELKLRALPEVGEALKAHYQQYPHFVWLNDGKINAKARNALVVLSSADKYGLDPADYDVVLPARDQVLTEEDLRIRNLVEFEMALSAKVLTYVMDATRGRVNPNKISGYHDLPQHKVDLAGALTVVSETDDVEKYLAGVNPNNAQFRALTEELARLKDADESERVEIADGTLIKPGKLHPELPNVIAAILLKGSDELKEKHAATFAAYLGGEDYSPPLVELVRDFQQESNLKPDGIVGRNSIRAMVDMSNAQKIEKVQLAMERVRWLPRQLGPRRVFINQPAYQAAYFENDKEKLNMRVVVGKKSNQTNFFYDEIETVEYNPYWGVPRSIIVKEMLPKLYNDPSYLDRNGYEVTTARGRRVASRNVDWYNVAAQNAPINVRQRPGKRNALGELKILFPNKHAIYMHDTPSKSLFNKDIRAFSHGCVRLHDPRGMAAAVLGTDKEYIASQIALGKNKAEKVPGNIPVYVSYFTAWPSADEEVKYYADIYSRDSYLKKAIASTVKARQGV
ncbi:MAG: L,D-transpeptidase family protein [Stappiaceae bacterium]